MAGIKYEVTPQRLRLLVKVMAKKDITTEQAEQFMAMFDTTLQGVLDNALRTYVVKMFTTK